MMQPVQMHTTTPFNEVDARGDMPNFSLRHIIVLVLLSFLVYSNSLFLQKVWDDVENFRIFASSWSDIKHIFTGDVFSFSGNSNFTAPYYRPLSMLSYSLDRWLWGEYVLGYHLSNILLHVMATIAAYFLALQILRDGYAAFASGLIFAVHPVHAEAVTWISARNEPLCAIFFFGSLWFYAHFRDKNSTIWLYVSLLLFSLALLTKEMAITLPGVVFLYEMTFYKKGPFRRFVRIIPFLLVASGYFLLRSYILGKTSTVSVSFLHHIKASIQIIGRYLTLLVLPLNQKTFYDISMKSDFFSKDIVFPLLIIFSLMLLGYFFTKIDSMITFCIGWFLITIFPVSGIPVLITPALMADRYLYIPSFGFALLFASVIRLPTTWLKMSESGVKLAHRDRSYVWVNYGVIFVVVLLAALTFRRNFIWTDDLKFFSEMVQDAPNISLGHYNLGNSYLGRGDITKAKQEWERAVELTPNYSEALNQLGGYYLMSNSMVAAKDYYTRAVAGNPDNAEAHYNLAKVLESLGEYEDAVAQYRFFLSNVPIEHKSIIPEVSKRINMLRETKRIEK